MCRFFKLMHIYVCTPCRFKHMSMCKIDIIKEIVDSKYLIVIVMKLEIKHSF